MDVIVQLRDLLRKGDYAGIARLAEALAAISPVSLETALALARAEIAAGRIKDARFWLDTAANLQLGPDEKNLVELEETQCAIFERLDLTTALDTADRVEARLLSALGEVPNEISARIRWAIIRLRLIAVDFGELSSASSFHLLNQLPALCARFRTLGLIDVSHSIALVHAERQSDQTAPELSAAAAESGLADGLAATAGEALLAEIVVRLRSGWPEENLLHLAEKAEQLFASIDHCHGAIDVDRIRARIGFERWAADPTPIFERCVERYLKAGYPKGALSTLLDISVHSHRRGDRRAALAASEHIERLATQTGYSMFRFLAVFRSADLALRERLVARSRDLCDEALAFNPPGGIRAGLYAMRGSALSMAGDHDQARDSLQLAISVFKEMGKEPEASALVPSLVSSLTHQRGEIELEVADLLLQKWIDDDKCRNRLSEAVAKLAQRAELRVLRVLGRRQRQEFRNDEAELLDEAKLLVAEAVALVPGDANASQWHTVIGHLGQVRGQIAGARGDAKEMENHLEESLQIYEKFGLAYEAANCRYLMGCCCLNRVNETDDLDFLQDAGAAQQFLSDALGFYDSVGGMRHQAAQSRHKLAMLYLNVQHRVIAEASADLRSRASEQLEAAAEDFDVLRRAYSSANRLATLSGKARLSVAAAEVNAEALRLHLSIDFSPDAAWRWAIRSKSQALDEVLGADAQISSQLKEGIRSYPHLVTLVQNELRLANQLANARAAERLAIGQNLSELRIEMQKEPLLREYAGLRSGSTAVPADLTAIAAEAPFPFVFVDWVASGNSLWLFIARPGAKPVAERINLALDRVRKFVEDELSPASFRMTLKHDPESLDVLKPLIAPLGSLTKPGEHLILCPTGPVQAIPLQAIKVNNVPLLERNPIANVPSLGVFRLCRQGVESSSVSPRAAVFGDPAGDRPQAREVAHRIALTLGVEPIMGGNVSASRFEEALVESQLVHYQGHALHCPNDPLSSHLELAGGKFEARRLFTIRNVRAEMISLGACQSAASVVSAGDEQLGMIPALLVAGVRSVTAAAWNVEDVSAALFMEQYFGEQLAGATPILALRTAAMAVRARLGFSAPYHWAPFVLHGDPWRKVTKMEVVS